MRFKYPKYVCTWFKTRRFLPPVYLKWERCTEFSDLLAMIRCYFYVKTLHLTSSGAHTLHYTCQSYFHQEMPSVCPLANIFAEFTTFSNLLASALLYCYAAARQLSCFNTPPRVYIKWLSYVIGSQDSSLSLIEIIYAVTVVPILILILLITFSSSSSFVRTWPLILPIPNSNYFTAMWFLLFHFISVVS